MLQASARATARQVDGSIGNGHSNARLSMTLAYAVPQAVRPEVYIDNIAPEVYTVNTHAWTSPTDGTLDVWRLGPERVAPRDV